MKSISTRHLVAIEEPLSSKPSKRKQGSTTLRSLRESLKFRGSMSPKKGDGKSTPARHTSPSRIRRASIDQQESHKSKQRFSAQRVSLFRYEYVRVRSSSVLRRGSSSSISSDMTKSSDNASYSSSRSRGSVRVKPTTLMAKGVLEIYQIYTPKANPAEKQQEMNYLSLGRKDNIVHPILPRLQVTRKSGLTQQFIIHFYNPDRYWEVEFLASSTGFSEEVSTAVKEFESCISRICDYSIVEEKPDKHKNETGGLPGLGKNTAHIYKDSADEKREMIGVGDSKQEIESDGSEDELAYLLEDEDDEKGIEIEKKGYGNVPLSGEAVEQAEDGLQDGAINEAFKKAMQRFKPSPYHRRGSVPDKLGDHHSLRKLSSYHDFEEQSQTLSKRLSYIDSKRFSSVPTWFSYETAESVTKRSS